MISKLGVALRMSAMEAGGGWDPGVFLSISALTEVGVPLNISIEVGVALNISIEVGVALSISAGALNLCSSAEVGVALSSSF